MENNRTTIKRLIALGLITTSIFVLLGFRLYYIQVFKYPTYSELALKQRGREIALYPQRGIIYDRNLVPLTNNKITPTIILPKTILEKDLELYNQILNYTSLSYSEFYKKLKSNEYLLQIPLIEKFEIANQPTNIFFVDVINRYNDPHILSHVIGYVSKSDNKGEAGVEKVYDEFLYSRDQKKLVIEYDKDRSVILGGAEYVNELSDPNNPTGVKLTIDEKIQKSVENIMDKEKINGAVVVAEVETGKILALSSRPIFNQNEIGDYFNNDDMALYNKAIQVGYPPGSLFKIIVLLAALEEEINLKNTYICKGYEDINNIRIKCTSEHGEITLEEGFAKSCNSTFIQVGKVIGGKSLIELAKRFNFGEKINIGLLEEVKGNLPEGDDLLGPAIGNISIGQGKIEATPLQITNLLMTIVNNGVQKHLTLIEGITNSEGQILKEFNKNDDKVVINSIAANIAYDYMIRVIKDGTGKGLDVDEIGGAGGKTGSAEAILNKANTIHGWFSGFYPEKNPKYVITVIVENGYSGSRSAAPIFEKIAKEINRNYPLY